MVSLIHEAEHQRLVNYRFKFSCCTGKGTCHAFMAASAALGYLHASLKQCSSDLPPPPLTCKQCHVSFFPPDLLVCQKAL